MVKRASSARVLAMLAFAAAVIGCGQRGPLYVPPPPPGPIPDRVPDRPIADPPPDSRADRPVR